MGRTTPFQFSDIGGSCDVAAPLQTNHMPSPLGFLSRFGPHPSVKGYSWLSAWGLLWMLPEGVCSTRDQSQASMYPGLLSCPSPRVLMPLFTTHKLKSSLFVHCISPLNLNFCLALVCEHLVVLRDHSYRLKKYGTLTLCSITLAPEYKISNILTE